MTRRVSPHRLFAALSREQFGDGSRPRLCPGASVERAPKVGARQPDVSQHLFVGREQVGMGPVLHLPGAGSALATRASGRVMMRLSLPVGWT